MNKIIHPLLDNDGNVTDGISVLHPTGEIPLADVARKDVPQGLPYLIITDADIPDDRIMRGAWEADFTVPDGFGDPAGYWADKAAEAQP